MNFFSYLPFILQSIISVQQAVPLLKGQSKLNIVLDLVALGLGLAGGLPQAHVAAVTSMVNSTVASLQANGVIVKDQPVVTGVVEAVTV